MGSKLTLFVSKLFLQLAVVLVCQTMHGVELYPLCLD